MTERAGLAALTAALLLAPGAEAKMIAAFSERVVAPGDRVTVELGVDAERFLSSLRVYLVPIAAAGTTKGQSDPHQRKVAEFRGRAAGAVPRAFDFEVPRLRPGLYASEIWFKGIQTDWYELSGKQPRLEIRQQYDSGAAHWLSAFVVTRALEIAAPFLSAGEAA
jgi:hypothetical protein